MRNRNVAWRNSFEARPIGRLNLWYVQVIWGKKRSFMNNLERGTSGVADSIIRSLLNSFIQFRRRKNGACRETAKCEK